MEKIINKLIVTLMILSLSVSISSCGGDKENEEPAYDPDKPYIGAWVVTKVSGWNYRGYYGQLVPDWDEEAQRFASDWMAKTIIVNADTKVEDNKIFYSENSDYIQYFKIGTTTEETMSVVFVEESYAPNGDIFSITTASMQFSRK